MRKLIILMPLLLLFSCDKPNENAIPGLEPVDVYLNLEKQGFTTTKFLDSEYGNSWVSKMNIANIDYTVNTFSNDINSVETVRASASVTPPKKIIATQDFFKMISTLPYENSKPQEASIWIENNFDNDKATIEINGVRFTIHAPSNLGRMLDIEKL